MSRPSAAPDLRFADYLQAQIDYWLDKAEGANSERDQKYALREVAEAERVLSEVVS